MSDLKRKLFIDAYLGAAKGNATQAAILAGYSAKTAKQQGSRLLTQADVQRAINRKLQRADLTTQARLQRLAKIADHEPDTFTGSDVIHANKLILQVNGALKEKASDAKVVVNIGFLQQPGQPPAVSVTTEAIEPTDSQGIPRPAHVAGELGSGSSDEDA